MLTGFGVAWGIMILIVLLGGGEGMYNGIQSTFSGFSKNSVRVMGFSTSKPYGDTPRGTAITFNQEILDRLEQRYSYIHSITPEIQYSGNSKMSYQDKTFNPTLKAVENAFFDLKNMELEEGRFFHFLDKSRSVCIIGSEAKKTLFKDKSAIGEVVGIGDDFYVIVGVIKEGKMFAQRENRSVFVSLDNYHERLVADSDFSSFSFILADDAPRDFIKTEFRTYIASVLSFDPKDRSALYCMDFREQSDNFNMMFYVIRAFLWTIGICLIISGVISLGNMMVVGIKERTRELGIRKAIGASPRMILQMIMLEAVLITIFSGALGMLTGMGLIEIGNILWIDGKEDILVARMQINMPIAAGTLVLLVLAGALAGWFPARKAMKISAVEALNTEY